MNKKRVDMSPLKVTVHCGSAHVKGKARNFSYYIASLFIPRKTSSGKWIYNNSGIHTKPRRSFNLCVNDAKDLVSKFPMCEFVEGYGSLHNKEI